MATGKDLIEAGFQPGRWFADALRAANVALSQGARFAPRALPLGEQDGQTLHMDIEAADAVEAANAATVRASMRGLLRTPVGRAGAAMPDACPAGPPGTIPVGDWEHDAPWRVRARAKAAAKA